MPSPGENCVCSYFLLKSGILNILHQASTTNIHGHLPKTQKKAILKTLIWHCMAKFGPSLPMWAKSGAALLLSCHKVPKWAPRERIEMQSVPRAHTLQAPCLFTRVCSLVLVPVHLRELAQLLSQFLSKPRFVVKASHNCPNDCNDKWPENEKGLTLGLLPFSGSPPPSSASSPHHTFHSTTAPHPPHQLTNHVPSASSSSYSLFLLLALLLLLLPLPQAKVPKLNFQNQSCQSKSPKLKVQIWSCKAKASKAKLPSQGSKAKVPKWKFQS